MGVSRPSLHIDYDEMHAMAHFMFSCGSLSFLGAENQGRSGLHNIKLNRYGLAETVMLTTFTSNVLTRV